MVEKPFVKRHANRLESHKPLPVNASVVLAIETLDDSWMYAYHTSGDASLFARKEGFIKYVKTYRGPVVGLLIVEGALHPCSVQLHDGPIEFLRISAAE